MAPSGAPEYTGEGQIGPDVHDDVNNTTRVIAFGRAPVGLDRRLADWAGRIADRSPWAHRAARVYTDTAYVHFGGWLTLGWWRAWRSGDRARLRGMLAVTTGTAVAFAAAQAVSTAVPRRRPFIDASPTDHGSVRTPLVHHAPDSSFPSDHATLAAVIAAGLWRTDRPLGAATSVAAAALTVDRLYLGVHYPSDLLAGTALGIATAGVTARTVRAT